MKQLAIILVLTILSLFALAQVPEGITHQAVIRDAANNLVANTTIGAKVSIIQGNPSGLVAYSETHNPTSNANGLISFVIGQGSTDDDFSTINWANGPYFIKTEADPEGSTNYTIEGVSQLWSVPYALSANANFSVGDSLVLKDEQGMTRFVLNPNTGTFKMMNNDTVWYSIEVGSPHVITHYNDDGSYTVSKGNGYEVYLFDEEIKNEAIRTVKFEQKHERDKFTSKEERFDSNTGNKWHEYSVESNIIRDDNGNYLTTEIRTTSLVYDDQGSEVGRIVTFKDEKNDFSSEANYKNGQLQKFYKTFIDQEGNSVSEEEYHHNTKVKKTKRVFNKSGTLISEEVSENDTRQSDITFTSSIVPEMGFRSHTVTEETFQGEDETLIKKEINTKASKHSPEEKYESKITTNQFYENGVLSREVIESLVDQWNETVKIQERIAKMFDQAGNQVSEIKVKNTSDANYNHQSGSMSRSNTTEMFANGIKVADQNRSMNHYPDPSNYTEDSESSATYLPDGSLISETLSEKATWPGGTLEKTTKTYVDFNSSIIQFIEQSQNGLPQNSSMTKDGIYRENTSFTHNDNLKKSVTSFKNSANTTTAKVTEEFNKNDALHKRTIEKPGEGLSTITQNNIEIELQASQVKSNGDHLVTGNLVVLGNLHVTGTKNFCIDHPADPHNKHLVHAAIESNEVLNQYSGNVISDTRGLAKVTLPDYFHLVNIDFRYQLTVVGATFARAIIFSEINENNQFSIKTDEPNTKVSWQVTAKRNDQYLIDHPFSDVVDK